MSSGVVQPPSPPRHPALDPLGTPEGPLTLRAETLRPALGVDVQLEKTVIRAAPHQEMLSRIEVLEGLIAELPNQQRRIGHNIRPIADEDVQEIRQAIVVLKAQPVVPAEAKAAGSTLKKIGERLGTYLDAFLLEASKSAGKEVVKRVTQLSYWYALYYALVNIANHVASLFH